jgi:hypothetical protein
MSIDHASYVVGQLGTVSYVAVLVVLLYVALAINANRKGK